MILTEGTAKVDNRKYKDTFHVKAKMIPFEQVEEVTGHAPGGVCPFGIKDGIEVYLDESLKRFETVYPAAGLIDYYRGKKLVLINKSVTPMDDRADLVINEPIGAVFERFLKEEK